MERFVVVGIVLVLLFGAVAGGLFFTVRSQQVASMQRSMAVSDLMAAEAAREAEALAATQAAQVATGDLVSGPGAAGKRRSLAQQLQNARAAADQMVPAHPDRVSLLEGWQHSAARPLLAQLPVLRQWIAAVEKQAGDAALLAELRSLATEIETMGGPGGKVEQVERRILWSRNLRRLTTAHPNARVSWQAAREAILQSTTYQARPIDILPQLGLVPLGENVATGEWEFYHLRSAWEPDVELNPLTLPIPTLDADGRVVGVADGGLVFALVPGSATAEPFFLARGEWTPAQRRRLDGRLDWHGMAAPTKQELTQAGRQGCAARPLQR